MVSVTVSIPKEIRERMNQFPEMNWSGFVRKQIIEKTKELEWKEDMLRKVQNEGDASDWAVSLQQKTRQKRKKQLEKKGLI